MSKKYASVQPRVCTEAAARVSKQVEYRAGGPTMSLIRLGVIEQTWTSVLVQVAIPIRKQIKELLDE